MVSLTNWFLQTLQLLLLLRPQSHSFLFSHDVTVRPGDLDAVMGRWNANFTCVLNQNMRSQYNASDLNFTYQIGTTTTIRPVPLVYVKTINASTIELRHFPEIDEVIVGTHNHVNCGIKDDRNYKPVEVHVKHRHEIPRIKDITVDNWETLTFTWETMEDKNLMYHRMDYKAWYWNNSSDPQPLQSKDCKDSECNITNPFQVASPNDVLIIKVNGSAETNDSQGILETVTSAVRVNLNDYLKPRKIDHKIINIVQNQSTKIVTFKPPKSNQNISYDINVNCSKHHFSKSKNITRSISDFNNAINSDGNSHEMLVTESLVGLPPYANCSVSVRSISVNGGYWSEWAHRDFQTLQDVPLAAPQSCRCCFQVTETGMDSLFHVIVYFTPLSVAERRGSVELYRIKMIKNGALDNNATEFRPDPLPFSYFVLNNLSNAIDYKINIEAKTQSGFNETLDLSASTILVPQSKRRPTSLSHKFTVVILNETSVRATLEMKERTGINKIFIFWCKGNVESDRPCQNVLKWKEFPITSTESAINITYIIRLKKPESHHEFIFGSGIEQNGKSSGITWSSCAYDISSSPPKPIIDSHNKTSSDVFISIEEPFCQKISDEQGFVIGYRLFFFPLQSPDSSDERRCLEEMKSRDFYRQQILNLTDLSPNQTYLILISSLSETSTSRNVSFEVTTLPAEALFVWPIIVSVVIFGVVVVSLVIACVPVKGKPLWKYLKDYRTVGKIVIPPASRFAKIDSSQITPEDEGYKYPDGTACDAMAVEVELSSADSEDSSASEPLLDISSDAENDSSKIAVLIDNDVSDASDGPGTAVVPVTMNDLVAVDVSFNDLAAVDVPFNDLVAVVVPVAFNDLVSVDVPGAFNDLVTDNVPVTFNDTTTSAVSIRSSGPGTGDVPDGSTNSDVLVDPSTINISVASKVTNGAEVPASANTAPVCVIPSVGLVMLSLRRTESNTSVENDDNNNSARILPSLFAGLTKVSEDHHHPSISGIISDKTDQETHQHQLQQPRDAETKTLLHVSSSECDGIDDYYIADQSMHDETPGEKFPSDLDEGYVDGSQRVCSVFLPVPSSEPAQPVMFDSGGYSDCNRIGSETEDAVSSSVQTESYDSSVRQIGDTSSDTGYRGVKIASLSSRSDDSVGDESRNDSDYPPMRIIDVDFYDDDDVSGKLEKEHVTDDVAISNTDVIAISDDDVVVLSTDFNISGVVTVPTGDVSSADVIASSPDVPTVIPNDFILKRSVDSKGELQWNSGENDTVDSVDEDCVYSTVVDVNVPCRTVGLGDPIPPLNSAELAGDDGYYSGDLVIGSNMSSSPRTPGFEGGGSWTLRDEVQHQRHVTDWSANPVSLSRSSTALPWSLNLQTSGGLEPFPDRVLPSILPSCV